MPKFTFMYCIMFLSGLGSIILGIIYIQFPEGFNSYIFIIIGFALVILSLVFMKTDDNQQITLTDYF